MFVDPKQLRSYVQSVTNVPILPIVYITGIKVLFNTNMVSYAEIVKFKAVPVPTMQPLLYWGSGRPMPTEAEKDDDTFFWNIVQKEAEISTRRKRVSNA